MQKLTSTVLTEAEKMIVASLACYIIHFILQSYKIKYFLPRRERAPRPPSPRSASECTINVAPIEANFFSIMHS